MTEKKIESGKLYISASFNNTLVTVTDETGNCLVWGSSGTSGFKGTRKATPFAATSAVEKVLKDARERFGLTEVDAALRAVRSAGIKISMIADVTPFPHNGPRARKKRRA